MDPNSLSSSLLFPFVVALAVFLVVLGVKR
jgi:hypothetical protein